MTTFGDKGGCLRFVCGSAVVILLFVATGCTETSRPTMSAGLGATVSWSVPATLQKPSNDPVLEVGLGQGIVMGEMRIVFPSDTSALIFAYASYDIGAPFVLSLTDGVVDGSKWWHYLTIRLAPEIGVWVWDETPDKWGLMAGVDIGVHYNGWGIDYQLGILFDAADGETAFMQGVGLRWMW